MTVHANVLGGSNAARLLACPASFKEALRAPVADVASPYAAEGTLLHDAIAGVLRDGDVPTDLPLLDASQTETLGDAIGMLDDLKRGWGGGFRIIAVEETLPFPGVAGSFGTVDLVLASKNVVLVVDWKFGQGVPVHALYTSPEGDSINPQLAFYAICARAARPRLFKNKKIVLSIVQPRLNAVSDVVTDTLELDDFQSAMTSAYLEALGPAPYRERGEHCRFAACKATCPLWTGPVFDLATIDPLAAQLRASQATTLNSEYSDFLSRALDLADIVETWAEEIRKQGHAYLEGGGQVPGWKLVPKRATRQWTDPEVVPAELVALGADDDDMFEPPKLRSVAQMEKALKPRGIEVSGDLYMSVSSGTTLAHADDRRPDATQAIVTEELRQALAAL